MTRLPPRAVSRMGSEEELALFNPDLQALLGGPGLGGQGHWPEVALPGLWGLDDALN